MVLFLTLKMLVFLSQKIKFKQLFNNFTFFLLKIKMPIQKHQKDYLRYGKIMAFLRHR